MAWAEACGLRADDDVSFPREAEYLILARVWIAEADRVPQRSLCTNALQLLERLLVDALAKNRSNSVVEILIGQALALWNEGRRSEALTTISRALGLAAPEGYVRRFVDAGPPIAVLLQAVSAAGVEPDYVSRLLAAFPGARVPADAGRGIRTRPHLAAQPAPAPYREPLSEREQEVLRLIAGGKSNAEVAQALVIAVSTVKTHTNSIFGKLGVTSRTQAIAQAHDLQLL